MGGFVQMKTTAPAGLASHGDGVSYTETLLWGQKRGVHQGGVSSGSHAKCHGQGHRPASLRAQRQEAQGLGVGRAGSSEASLLDE